MKMYKFFVAIVATALCGYAQETAPAAEATQATSEAAAPVEEITVVVEEAAPAEAPVAVAEVNSVEAGSFVKESYISLGVSYRKFDKVDFKSQRMKGFDGFYLNNDGINNMLPYNTIGTVGKGNGHNTPGQSGHHEYVTVVNTTGGNVTGTGHFSDGEDSGLTLGYNYQLYRQNAIGVDLVFGFQYFSIDTANHSAYGHGFKSSAYDAIVWNGVPTQKGDYGNVYDNAGNLVSGSYKAKFEMDLYQFDLGANLSYSFENGLQFNVAAGPTIGFANLSSSSGTKYSVSNAPACSKYNHDNGVDVIPGCYASAGLAYWFTERIGLSADIRYDESFDHASTKYANLDLDSWGGSLKLLYHF